MRTIFDFLNETVLKQNDENSSIFNFWENVCIHKQWRTIRGNENVFVCKKLCLAETYFLM